MNKIIYRLLFLLTLVGCTPTGQQEVNDELAIKQFSRELQTLQSYFHIPGMAVLVKKEGQVIYEDYLGFADVDNKVPVDSLTVFPMASLTKIFSAVLAMQLVEKGQLSLEDSLGTFFPEISMDQRIQVKHLLSHTSQGIPGEQFYYSFRYGMLTKILGDVSGATYADLFQENIIRPLGLQNTFLLRDSAQLANDQRTIAQPYFYQGATEKGFIDYGFSASSGLTSTVRDFSKLDDAFEKNNWISATATDQMLRSSRRGLPYGLGIFSQQLAGMPINWGYGQYDCYSSLYLKIPEKGLTLILAANNNLMSDPARLIYGNAGYSLFALSFLKNFALDQLDMELLTDFSTSEEEKIVGNPDFHRQKLLAQAIAESFMAVHEPGRVENSEQLLKTAFELFPDYESYGDLTLLHNLSFLQSVRSHYELPASPEFDPIIEKLGAKLLNEDPQSPYANYYLGNYHAGKGNNELAAPHFQQIVTASNFSPWWYTQEASQWLEANGQ